MPAAYARRRRRWWKHGGFTGWPATTRSGLRRRSEAGIWHALFAVRATRYRSGEAGSSAACRRVRYRPGGQPVASRIHYLHTSPYGRRWVAETCRGQRLVLPATFWLCWMDQIWCFIAGGAWILPGFRHARPADRTQSSPGGLREAVCIQERSGMMFRSAGSRLPASVSVHRRQPKSAATEVVGSHRHHPPGNVSWISAKVPGAHDGWQRPAAAHCRQCKASLHR